MFVVTTAAAIKVSVATIERGDNRERPATPWPEVHPLPRRVPNPTSNPAIIIQPEPSSVCTSKPPKNTL